jgi:hypothetical protein
MDKHPASPRPSATDQILDLLLDALLERQATRQVEGEKPHLDQPQSMSTAKPAATEESSIKPMERSFMFGSG